MTRLRHLIPRFNLNSSAARAIAIGVLASVIGCATAAGVRAEAAAPAGTKSVSFNRDIRPILADKCFKCHGPDARERKGKLRLDNARDARAPAASGSVAIVPGTLDDSELYQRITSPDPDERMPPPKSGKTLSAAEIASSRPGSKKGPSIRATGRLCPLRRPPCRP